MNALVISQETVDSQLAECLDGETADFTIKGGTYKLVPGVGAVVSGDNITKNTYAPKKGERDEVMGPPPQPTRGGMSAGALAVVNRKSPSY